MPTLLINADDFGLHPDIDRGILTGIDAGRLTGVSVCANGPCVDWSVVRGLQQQGIDVGVHVTLVGERWLTQPWTIRKWTTLLPWLALPGRAALVRAEIAAQVDRFLEQGVRPTHLDSHQHVHVFANIWRPCQAIAGERGIPRIRVPRAASPAAVKRSSAGWVLEHLSRRRLHGLNHPAAGPACIGLAAAGHNTGEIYARELDGAQGGDVEVVAHPGFASPALQQTYAEWQFDWEAEREALLSDAFAAACDRNGYALDRRA